MSDEARPTEAKHEGEEGSEHPEEKTGTQDELDQALDGAATSMTAAEEAVTALEAQVERLASLAQSVDLQPQIDKATALDQRIQALATRVTAATNTLSTIGA